MQKFLLNFYMHFSQYFLCILLWQQEISFFLSPCLITINFSGFYFSPEIHFVQVHTHNSRLHQQSDFTAQTCKLGYTSGCRRPKITSTIFQKLYRHQLHTFTRFGYFQTNFVGVVNTFIFCNGLFIMRERGRFAQSQLSMQTIYQYQISYLLIQEFLEYIYSILLLL